jgi:hypothetical protein
LVAAVPEVTDLKLERCPQLTNLAPLTALQQLVCLSLDDLPSVTDLQMLSSLRCVAFLVRACGRVCACAVVLTWVEQIVGGAEHQDLLPVVAAVGFRADIRASRRALLADAPHAAPRPPRAAADVGRP